MLAAALIFGLATASQIIAPRLRIPSLILLLPAGFLLGLAAPDCRAHAPDENFPIEPFEAGIRLTRTLLEELAR